MEESTSKQNKKRKWLLILLFLLLFAIITVGIVLLIIGEQAVDVPEQTTAPTIVITPPEEVEPTGLPLSLSVQVQTADGSPYAFGDLELHSDPMTATTNEYGYAFFYDVATGDHTLYVYSSTGAVLASMQLTLTLDETAQTLTIQGTNSEGYTIFYTGVTAVIELKLQISDGTLGISSGGLISYNGEYSNSEYLYEATQNIVTPNGNIVKTDGEIVILNVGTIDNQGNLTLFDDASDGYTLEDGAKVGADGSVYISGGFKTYKDTSNGAYVSGSTVDPLDADNASGSVSSSGSSGGGSSGSILADRDESDDTEKLITDSVDLEVSDDIGSWDDAEYLNIFDLGDETVIYPGSSGEYTFYIANPSVYDVLSYIEITDLSYIEITEDGEIETTVEHDAQIPLLYQLKYLDTSTGEYVYVTSDWMSAGDFTSTSFTILSAQSIEFILEWDWPFDGASDEADTAVGSSDNLDHIILVTLHSEQYIEEEI